MAKVFIIHGAGGSPKSNWFPWLKEKLEESGNDVHVPEFPIGNQQSLSNWLSVFDKYKKLLDSETVMVGHSLGPAFILNLLEKTEVSISTAFFVAPFVDFLGLPGFDEVNKTFMDHKFDWKKIKRKCKSFYVYASDNDPYVPLEKSKLVADKLDAKFKLVPRAKHMNAEAGYTSFELLLEDIKGVLK